MYGGEGPDIIDGGNGDDLIFGGASGTGMNGVDQLIGGNGNDTIYGGTGIDKISGEAGDDVIYGGGDTDPFTHAGDGNDYVDGGTGGDLLWGDAGDDIVVGGADQDVLYGGSGDDILRPGAPSQALIGQGVDEVVGGLGNANETAADIGFNLMDLSDWGAGVPGVVADFATQGNPSTTIKNTANDFPAWFQIQGLIATANNDTIIGDDTGNWIIGGSGNDTITGGAGSDIIVGNHIRLDSLIGNYLMQDPITKQWVQASYNYTAFDTASHRAGTGVYGQGGVAATLATSGDLIDQANAVAGTHIFDKHFTSMLSSAIFKDLVLGNDMVNSTGTGTGVDTAVYSGNLADYNFKGVLANTANEGTILGILIQDRLVNGVNPGDPKIDLVTQNGGTAGAPDLLIGMSYIQFKDQKVAVADLLGPRFTGVVASTSINENSTAVIETFSVSLATGNPLSVQLGTNVDDQYFNLVNNGNGTYSLVAKGTGLNFENLSHYGSLPYNVDIVAKDTVSGATNVANIAVTALNVNEAATGSIALTGAYTSSNAAVGSSVAVTTGSLNSLLDPDLVRPGATTGKVVDQPFSAFNPQPTNTSNPYQWQSSTNGTTWTNVGAQTTATLSANSGNAVTQYRVVSSYADVFGVHNAANDTTAISGTVFVGTNNNTGDNITGTAKADLVLALAGNDTINGFQGADTIDGGVGTDVLALTGLNGINLLTGQVTDLNAATDAQLVNVERINLATGALGLLTTVKLDLSKQSDNLTIDTTGDGLAGGGADSITVGTGVENITTGGGNDTVNGFATGDTVDGGAGTDTIQINTASDATAIAAAVNAAIVNVEVITAANATAGVTLDLHNQTEAFTSINGSNFADTIIGTAATTNKIYAGGGNDTIIGYSNAATVDGGAGIDTLKVLTAADATNVSNTTVTKLLNVEVLDFSSVPVTGTNTGVTVSMGNFNTGAGGTAVNFKYIGSAFNDTLTAHNTLTTTTGDTLQGGAGNDTLTGGTGHDTFAFEATAAANGLDTINSFTKTGTAYDTLQVSSFLTGLNATNLFLTGTGFANVAATAYDQHVVLLNSTQDLSTTAGFNAVFGAGAGHLALLTADTQKAVLIEGTTGNNTGNDKMYYVTHDAQGTHVTQVATLVGVGQFAAATDVHVA